jgi:hypothetical protein
MHIQAVHRDILAEKVAPPAAVPMKSRLLCAISALTSGFVLGILFREMVSPEDACRAGAALRQMLGGWL